LFRKEHCFTQKIVIFGESGKMRTKFTLLLSMLLCVTSTTFGGKIIYIDADANGINDGSSWENAYNLLQDALAGAQFGDQIRVAAGTYKPDQGAGITHGDRNATFLLINGLPIKGGYAGSGEPDPNVRDPNLYDETILSGDLAGDDGPDFANNSENSYHVVTANTAFPAVTLDGFTITGGNANGPSDSPLGWGGGMYNYWSRPTLTNCTFTANFGQRGGGMYNDKSSPILTNCTFSGNTGNDAAGMMNASSTPKLTNCTFTGNSSKNGGGGGMLNGSSSPNLTDCTFTENSATNCGGGICDDGSSSPTLTNCTFTTNSSAMRGGGMYNHLSSSPKLTDCTFTENSATDCGGGMDNGENSSPSLTNCTFTGNSTTYGGGGAGMHNWNGSSPTLTNCTFTGNSGSFGGGMCNDEHSSPNLSDCTFTRNSATGNGGGMWNWNGSSPTVTKCTFTGNLGDYGGGMANADNSSPKLTNCTFTGNYAQNGGGMLNCTNNDSPVLTNCAFIANWAVTSGGGMNNAGSGTAMTNCTFGGNEAGEGAGLYNAAGNATLANCILWDPGWSGEIWTHNISAITLTYSDIRDGWPGEGNINADPCFVDPEGPDGIPGNEDDNLRLRSGSLCIDAGDNTAVPAGITTDLDGNPRFVDDPNTLDKGKGAPPIVDMGAYEGAHGGVCGDLGHPYPKGDLNKDCRVDFADFAEFADNWLVCTAPKCD
jgi:parallel beta-helix repeat protein